MGATVGIDFGTTNSSVALLTGGAVRLVSFPTLDGATTSSRSVVYLQRPRTGRRAVSVWTGPAAIEHYLAVEDQDEVQRRLVQSLKSHLSARTLTGTEIFGRNYRLEELVARMLTDLRLRAGEELGYPVTHAVVGRPVQFVGADNEADNDFALTRLHAAFTLAGFQQVTFVPEPVAAAHAYGATLNHAETVLIGDFGGGTTDFSLLRIDPAASNTCTVLGNAGVGLAGDAFDAKIVRYLISPALGSDSMARSLGKLLPALPAWIYANLERWHTLSFLRTRAVTELLRTTQLRALEPLKIAALRNLIEADLGYRMHAAVGRLKIALSHNREAEFLLDTGTLHLQATVTRDTFEGWIAPELARIRIALDTLMAAHPGVTVDRVFLTGGTSLVPAVRHIFTTRFGESQVRSGDAFTSVATGLAHMAARL